MSTLPTSGETFELTPSCGEQDTQTHTATEGPYFTPHSPEKTSLLQQVMKGTLLSLTGYVLDIRCQPVKHALLDFWHVDDNGNYDMQVTH
jgi:protocatechuate 3,4-dioxygenase beta subunit